MVIAAPTRSCRQQLFAAGEGRQDMEAHVSLIIFDLRIDVIRDHVPAGGCASWPPRVPAARLTPLLDAVGHR
jgi:hypothetical protein